MKNKNRPLHSTLFAFDHEKKILITSYIPKRGKNVTLLSSFHSGDAVVENNKPALIEDYNFGKKGVDQMDENVEEFTSRRKTLRWPLLVFFNILDISALNAFLLLKNDGYNLSRKQFLKCLSFQLAKDSARQRHDRNPNLPRQIREAACKVGFLDQEAPASISTSRRVLRCHVCSKNSRSKCDSCGRAICPLHRRVKKSCKCSFCL